jgi:tetratricopeptide (TPR) repeat protein
MGPIVAVALGGWMLAATGGPLVDLGKVGTVSLPTSCKKAVQKDFDRSMALLHSFFYEEARIAFRAVLEKDPSCAMGHWGVAMTYYHPLWAPPLPEERTPGSEASARAAALGGKSVLERGLIAAMEGYWKGGLQSGVGERAGEGVPSCHGGAPTPAGGAQAFRTALEQLNERFPQDPEVGTFYALSLLGTAPVEDRALAQQKKAAGLLEALWKKHPHHPGVVHYLIHAYDYPETARSGLPAARAYAQLAPQVPHALHMPSHIFVRLGLWDDDVASNLSALAAAQRWMEVRHPNAAFSDALHASDYLLYGYLQQGRDDLADAEVERMAGVKEVFPPRELAAAVARAIAPIRSAIERERWEEASKLEVAPIAAFAAYPFVRGFVEYSHGLGLAHTGRAQAARDAAVALEKLSKDLPAGPLGYWAKLLESYRMATLGWVARAEKKEEEAVKLLTSAAELEDRIGPHPVMPGPLLPAREQLADLLLELGRHGQALTAYQETLARYPGRLRSTVGAMRAAAKGGQGAAAKLHAREAARLLTSSVRPVREEATKLSQ